VKLFEAIGFDPGCFGIEGRLVPTRGKKIPVQMMFEKIAVTRQKTNFARSAVAASEQL
jgi:hypothetical protein